MNQATAEKSTPSDLQFLANTPSELQFLLSVPAQQFIAALCEKFMGRRNKLLARRVVRQNEFDAGALPDFLPDTKAIREGDWKVAEVPADLLDRRGGAKNGDQRA